MLQYSFRWRKEKPAFLVMDFHPELSVLSSYLMDVNENTYNNIVREVQSVLNGEVDCIEWDVEWYGASITRETTRVYVTIDEDNYNEYARKGVSYNRISTR